MSYGFYTYITKHILYVFVYFLYFSCVGLKPILSYHIFHISRRSTGLVLLLSSHILSYVFTYVFMYFHILYCHIIYFHLILFIYVFSFMPVNTKEVDTETMKGPKALYSLYETVVYEGPGGDVIIVRDNDHL